MNCDHEICALGPQRKRFGLTTRVRRNSSELGVKNGFDHWDRTRSSRGARDHGQSSLTGPKLNKEEDAMRTRLTKLTNHLSAEQSHSNLLAKYDQCK
jgi:hypothetical protein